MTEKKKIINCLLKAIQCRLVGWDMSTKINATKIGGCGEEGRHPTEERYMEGGGKD